MAVPDLAALGRKEQALSPAQVVEGEVQAGLRCSVCQERFASGVEVTKMMTQFVPQAGGLVGMIGHAYCCPKEECREKVTEDGTAVAVRPVEQVFLTPDPVPHPKQEGGEQDGSANGSANVGEGPGADGAAPGGQ